MRLLLTTDAVGGVWRYSIDLAQGLAARGHEVVLAVLGPAPSQAQHGEAKHDRITLALTGLPLDWTAPDPAALTHTSTRLATLARLTAATTIHLHAPALVGNAQWPVPVAAVTHSCLGTWWAAMREGPPPEDFAWRIDATAKGLAAAKIVAPTKAHAEATTNVYGPTEITVIHNGTTFPPPCKGGDGCGSRVPRSVLTAGRLYDEAKNLRAIDEAARTIEIKAAGPTRGPNGAEIHLPNLHLLGTLTPTEMVAAYATAKVYVSMAKYEPFGLGVLEAAKAGLRLVLSDIPTFRELWSGAATFTTEQDLPHTLRQALAAPGDGGAQARARTYSIDRTVDATIAFHQVLA